MKKLDIHIVITIATIMFWYLIFAFVLLQFNSFKWEQSERTFYVFFVLISNYIGHGIIIIYKK